MPFSLTTTLVADTELQRHVSIGIEQQKLNYVFTFMFILVLIKLFTVTKRDNNNKFTSLLMYLLHIVNITLKN